MSRDARGEPRKESGRPSACEEKNLERVSERASEKIF